MAQPMMANQRQLEVELFHNQAGYLSDPPSEYFEMFNSLMVGPKNCLITHALRSNPLICNDCENTFWNTTKVNRRGANGAGAIEAKVQDKEIIITEAVVREVLKFGDQPHYPTSFVQRRVLPAL
ncbi:hypothetical protein Hanom_Chr12g01164151 [Helianthus anomalus]